MWGSLDPHAVLLALVEPKSTLNGKYGRWDDLIIALEQGQRQTLVATAFLFRKQLIWYYQSTKYSSLAHLPHLTLPPSANALTLSNCYFLLLMALLLWSSSSAPWGTSLPSSLPCC